MALLFPQKPTHAKYLLRLTKTKFSRTLNFGGSWMQANFLRCRIFISQKFHFHSHRAPYSSAHNIHLLLFCTKATSSTHRLKHKHFYCLTMVDDSSTSSEDACVNTQTSPSSSKHFSDSSSAASAAVADDASYVDEELCVNTQTSPLCFVT
jgi:hypothetical protein